MTLRELCAWCERVLVEGDPGAAVTHGICPTCRLSVENLRVQYIVYQLDGRFNLRRFDGSTIVGRVVAAHFRIEAVRLAIPTTHVRADVPVEGRIVEVWIDRRIAPSIIDRANEEQDPAIEDRR